MSWRLQLQDQLPPEILSFDVPLQRLSRWRIGGPVDALITPRGPDELARTLQCVAETGVPRAVVGDATNLLFDDDGFRGALVRVGGALGATTFTSVEGAPWQKVEVGAGRWTPAFVRETIRRGLGGLVHAIGIPGTVGGLIAMNGGSLRQGIGSCVLRVEALDWRGRRHSLDQQALDFGRRRSRLQSCGYVAISASLRLPVQDAPELRREALGILAARRRKFPKVRANCGSVFVSDPRHYAMIGPPGAAIEHAGLKGARVGQAQISPEHANFIVNLGGAKSADVIALIRLARDRVHDQTGLWLEAEVRRLRPDGRLRPAHEECDDDVHVSAH